MQIGFPSPVLYSCGAPGTSKDKLPFLEQLAQVWEFSWVGRVPPLHHLENTGEQPKAKIDVCVESPRGNFRLCLSSFLSHPNT